ncbi:LacI family DNA-binding transcriptional regulator [Secundilactobacillus yichangensis]|uniref:LacI family DNA-binding transcriptional regulator n=1 Tax=Secundilactobacillus yichangensis TaxID=2799580 RepID=UPI001F18D61B|nr:LacI family DNA-binding transcriptional regulator [Secundilactobacillus yichangensis]
MTIIDVAKRAGVSNTTVSRAFTPNSIIKESTRQRIFKIAAELGYSPNLSARGLVTNKKFVIGAFFSRIHTHMSTYLSTIISDVHDALPENYILSVEGIDRVTNFDFQVKNRFDGILVVSQSTADDQFIAELSKSNVPAVVILRPIDATNIDNVYSDDAAGIRKIVEYAARNGHRKFGYINGQTNYVASTKRAAAMIKTCSDNQLSLDKDAIIDGSFNLKSGYNAIDKIIDLPASKRPTCVVCASDDIALGAIRRCQERKIEVPKEISITGFDNISYDTAITPALTTINNPFEGMAKYGVQMLFERMDNHLSHNRVKIIEPKIIIRDSVADINEV